MNTLTIINEANTSIIRINTGEYILEALHKTKTESPYKEELLSLIDSDTRVKIISGTANIPTKKEYSILPIEDRLRGIRLLGEIQPLGNLTIEIIR